MDKLEKYRHIIKEVLTRYASHKFINQDQADEFERQTIFDETNNHYQVLNVGWEKYERTFSSPIHIDIKDGKLWNQQNLTDYDFIGELIGKGIPKKDIVLAFDAPYKRKYTGFAVA